MAEDLLKIGIDARFYGPVGKGLGRYVQRLVENLQEVDKENEYVLFLTKENFELCKIKNKNFRKVLADIPWYSLKEQIVLPRIFSKENLDLLHVPHFNIPVFYGGETVVTIHDLIKHEWQEKSATTRAYPIYLMKHLGYRFVMSQAVHNSGAIITPSKHVKKKVAEKFSLDPGKIHVTYEAGTLAGKERSKKEKKIEKVLEKHKISKPYFLYVGNVYPYKNVSRLLDAVKILNEEMGKTIELVLVGARDIFRERLKKEIAEKGVLKYVVLTGYVTDADLIDLYKEAEAYVHPSLSEGFGLGSVEAMSLGTPVVEADATCLPEIAGDAALYFDPYSPKDMADKLKKVLEDKKLQKELSKKGKKKAKEYSWERMAKETLEVYQKAAKNG